MSLDTYLYEVILEGTAEYWCVEKQYTDANSSVYLISIDNKQVGERPIVVDSLSIGDLKHLERIEILTNIPLSESYAPFQYGLRLGDFKRAFPLPENIREFLAYCLNLDESLSFWEYQSLYLTNFKPSEDES